MGDCHGIVDNSGVRRPTSNALFRGIARMREVFPWVHGVNDNARNRHDHVHWHWQRFPFRGIACTE